MINLVPEYVQFNTLLSAIRFDIHIVKIQAVVIYVSPVYVLTDKIILLKVLICVQRAKTWISKLSEQDCVKKKELAVFKSPLL